MLKLSWRKFSISAILLVLLLFCLFNSQAIAVESKKFPTGDFRWRSYLRVNHPKFRNSPQGRTFLNAPSCKPIVGGKIYRFIEGTDLCLIPMLDPEIAQKLNDPFATSLLRQGSFPNSVDVVATAIAGAGLNLQQSNYSVGEGSQIPIAIADRDEPRNLRYVLTWGNNPTSAQIFPSAVPGGNSSFLQVIAWDTRDRTYNFYEFREQVGQLTGRQVAYNADRISLIALKPC